MQASGAIPLMAPGTLSRARIIRVGLSADIATGMEGTEFHLGVFETF